MGVTCTLRRISAADLRRLQGDPAQVRTFLTQDYSSLPPLREVRPRGLLGFLWRFVPITISESPVDTAAAEDLPDQSWPLPESNGDELDLDKAWHGLHFLFTGTAWEGALPAGFLIGGGGELGDDGLEFGPVRGLGPGEVRQIAAFLDSLSLHDLERRYDPDGMTKLQIYPEEIWTPRDASGDSGLMYLQESFEVLRSFVSKSASAGDGLIVYVA